MLDLIKYVVEQFAEDKANIRYEVEETEEAITVTVLFPIRIWARSSANRARSQRRSAPLCAPQRPRIPKSTASRSKNARRNNVRNDRAAEIPRRGFLPPRLHGVNMAARTWVPALHMSVRTWGGENL